jgi:Fe-S cluster assembly protein SufD
MNSTVTTEDIAATGRSPLDATVFAARLEAAGEPSWLQERRQAAWQFCAERNLAKDGIVINRKDERWRYSGQRGWTFRNDAGEEAVLPVASARAELVARYAEEQFPWAVATLAFADDQVLGEAEFGRSVLPPELAQKGVIFLPLDQALRDPACTAILREHLFQSDRSLGGETFLKLHQAYARAGAFLYVPKGVEIPGTFVALHGNTAPGVALFPHTLIVAEENSSVNFLDYYRSFDQSAPVWSLGASTVIARPGARVFRKSIQNLNLASFSYQADTTVGERDADVKNIAVHLGARHARFENQVRLAGPGAHLKLYALTVASGTQEFDQRTFQEHAAPRATSDLLYKNALLDQARTIFAGMIRVEPDAAETDAYQQNRNLLLDPSAEANSLPGLEIMNCNVRCTHGATTGRLDPEELFYLRTRGIPRALAHQLLVFGFFEEVIEKVENPPLAELLRRLVREKFAQQ